MPSRPPPTSCRCRSASTSTRRSISPAPPASRSRPMPRATGMPGRCRSSRSPFATARLPPSPAGSVHGQRQLDWRHRGRRHHRELHVVRTRWQRLQHRADDLAHHLPAAGAGASMPWPETATAGHLARRRAARHRYGVRDGGDDVLRDRRPDRGDRGHRQPDLQRQDRGSRRLQGRAVAGATPIKVESYLALKYGITLNQTPARSYVDAPRRDDLGCVAQRRRTATTSRASGATISAASISGSRSSSSAGDFVTIGHGAIAADNASNTNAFGADKSVPDLGPRRHQLVMGNAGGRHGAAADRARLACPGDGHGRHRRRQNPAHGRRRAEAARCCAASMRPSTAATRRCR